MQEVVDSALSELSDSLTTKGSSPPPCVDMDDLMQQTNYICSKNAAKQQTLPPHISQSLSPDLLQAAERALMHPSADDIYGTDHLPAFGLDVDTTHSGAESMI